MRPFAVIRTEDQWVRAAHDGTVIDLETGGVELDWTETPGPAGTDPAPPGGLAFDSACRLYRSRPDVGRIERRRWPAGAATGPAEDLVVAPTPGALGDFAAHESPPPLRDPRALAVDVDDRLFIAEAGARRVLVLDLWSGRLLERVPLAAAPLDLAAGSRWVWVLLEGDAGVVRMHARGSLLDRALPSLPTPVPTGAAVRRLARGDGDTLWLLVGDAADRAWAVELLDAGGELRPTGVVLDADRASDLELDGDGALVVARAAEETFLRYGHTETGWVRGGSLAARGYDGAGIVRTPDGRIAYWSRTGLRTATAARRRFREAGSVTTFRLDSGALQTAWGRLFVDACVPHGTRLLVHCTTADDDDGLAPIPRTRPANAAEITIVRPDLSPPMPPAALAPGTKAPARPLYRRATGRELPWVRPAAGDRFETYEAPVIAQPGRYLWVTLDLIGATHASPRVRALRAEHPGHEHLRRLPRAFSREPAPAEFLRRYLALPDTTLDDLEGRSEQRAVLVHPAGTPVEALPWLAGFTGLVLDDRWPEAVRRALIAEAVRLFRVRGTVAGLERFLRLVLGDRRDVIIVERWRVRGLGGALLGGEDTSAFSGSVVGGGLRVGGATGAPGEAPLATTTADAFATNAHRFTVVIPAELSADELDMVRHVLDLHRPAHTVVDVCTVGAGMRVGRGLHVGLLSMIGRTGGFRELQVGETTLGRDAVLGRPGPGTGVGTGRLGQETRVG
jgi:phage tail-like protein